MFTSLFLMNKYTKFKNFPFSSLKNNISTNNSNYTSSYNKLYNENLLVKNDGKCTKKNIFYPSNEVDYFYIRH